VPLIRVYGSIVALNDGRDRNSGRYGVSNRMGRNAVRKIVMTRTKTLGFRAVLAIIMGDRTRFEKQIEGKGYEAP